MSEWCRGRGREPGLLPYWSPGQVVTRLNTYYGDDRHCCLQRVYIGVCLHQAVRPSLTYTGHGHCLSLDLDMFRLFLTDIHFQEGFWATRMLGFSLALSHEEHFSACWCGLLSQLPFLAYFLNLFLPEEELRICLLAEM